MIIDSHIHCSDGVEFERDILPDLTRAQVDKAVVFCPVDDIYDRGNPEFQDNGVWREQRRTANRCVLAMGEQRADVIPYYFVWNDFDVDELARGYCGVKWHRHQREPIYHYDDPRCARFIDALTDLRLPVLLEETLPNTLRFIRELAPAATVIIPHLGLLNGGYEALDDCGIWRDPRVYADTALAEPRIVAEFVRRYGADKLLFGSDYPFGRPSDEILTVRFQNFGDDDQAQVLGGNLMRLLGSFSPAPPKGLSHPSENPRS
jgi:predicted TIM-barrel fold metal-dependent hydrolase